MVCITEILIGVHVGKLDVRMYRMFGGLYYKRLKGVQVEKLACTMYDAVGGCDCKTLRGVHIGKYDFCV